MFTDDYFLLSPNQEVLLAECGIIVSHETVRRRAEKFGRDFANQNRRRAPKFGDKWHLDDTVKLTGNL
jgi:putative transposase